MELTRNMLKWIDKKEKEITENVDETNYLAKCFGLGLAEGALDGCVIIGMLVIGLSLFVKPNDKNTK
jgi:hypothetical protein